MKTIGAFIGSALAMALYIITVIFFIGAISTLFKLMAQALAGRRN